MARGRMISNAICRDKKLNDLSSDTSRLAFTWLVTHADREGRVHGDPAIVRSLVFPRRSDVLVEDVEAFIREWADAGLITWYEADGDMYIAFMAFEKNQGGLRKDREPESIHPPPPTIAGTLPDDCRINDGLREEKGIEEKGRESALDIYKTITGLTPDYYRQEPIIKDILSVVDKYGYSGELLIEYLEKHFDRWCNTRTDSGKKYNPSNPKWLEWAITGYTPEKINKAEASGYKPIVVGKQ